MRPLGDRTCPGCGKEYWGAQQWQHDKCKVVHAVVHSEPKVVHKHGVYADSEKRKKYRREWMRKKRALVS